MIDCPQYEFLGTLGNVEDSCRQAEIIDRMFRCTLCLKKRVCTD